MYDIGRSIVVTDIITESLEIIRIWIKRLVGW